MYRDLISSEIIFEYVIFFLLLYSFIVYRGIKKNSFKNFNIFLYLNIGMVVSYIFTQYFQKSGDLMFFHNISYELSESLKSGRLTFTNFLIGEGNYLDNTNNSYRWAKILTIIGLPFNNNPLIVGTLINYMISELTQVKNRFSYFLPISFFIFCSGTQKEAFVCLGMFLIISSGKWKKLFGLILLLLVKEFYIFFALLIYFGYKIKLKYQIAAVIVCLLIIGYEPVLNLLNIQYTIFTMNSTDASTWIPSMSSQFSYPESIIKSSFYALVLPFPYYFGFVWSIFIIDMVLFWRIIFRTKFQPLLLLPIIIITMITPVFGTLVRYRAPFLTILFLKNENKKNIRN